jgi:hypothetical protein
MGVYIGYRWRNMSDVSRVPLLCHHLNLFSDIIFIVAQDERELYVQQERSKRARTSSTDFEEESASPEDASEYDDNQF